MALFLQEAWASRLSKVLVDGAAALRYRTVRSHRLMVLSCYIHLDAVKQVIADVAKEIRLTEVELAFEFKEAFRMRLPNDLRDDLQGLEAWCRKKAIHFRWHAIRGGALMHAKAFSVVQTPAAGVGAGVVMIGSANVTLPGLGLTAKGTPSNIELLHVSEEKQDVSDFLEIWDALLKRSRDIAEFAKREDVYEFRHALLSSGVFLHDWKEGLSAKLGVRYSLTENGRNNVSVNPELVDLGFKVDKATITRNPLPHISMLHSRALPKPFQRRYAVDTLLGRWCPHSVWNVVEDVTESDSEFEAFYASFLVATGKAELDIAYAAEAVRSDRLLKMDLVTPDEGRLERWRARVESFRESKEKLVRVFKRLEAFDMPYDYQSRAELQDLWESLLDSIALKRNKSFVAKKIEDAEVAGDLELLLLSDEEEDRLRRELA